jgi:hypothetical protein
MAEARAERRAWRADVMREAYVDHAVASVASLASMAAAAQERYVPPEEVEELELELELDEDEGHWSDPVDVLWLLLMTVSGVVLVTVAVLDRVDPEQVSDVAALKAMEKILDWNAFKSDPWHCTTEPFKLQPVEEREGLNVSPEGTASVTRISCAVFGP